MRGAAPRPSRGATLGGAGFLGVPVIGPTASGESAGLGLAGGGAFLAISPAEPLRPGLASGVTDGFDSIFGDEIESVEDRFVPAEDGPVGRTRVTESSGRALRN